MSPKTDSNFLQLPLLDAFEPLTKGTNLPSAPYEPSPVPSSNNSVKDQEADIERATTITAPDATTPPRSPTSPTSTRPGSMRRFLSRVSLNSTYDKDKDPNPPPMSPTGSVMSIPGRNSVKRSWWRWKDKNPTPPTSIDAALEQAPAPPAQVVPTRAITPPPKLPDLAPPPTAFDDDLFKSFK
ncbi:hypothetical protein BGX38DRAFT_1176234 [Terfezia claveryi]|nr:hypothetical protein BGX38DRAFT_1176234 [Terfezia claveryi]